MRFVGRTAELAELESALAPAPRPRVAWLVGPAGIGKTALARRLASGAAAAGHAVQWIACDEIGSLRAEVEVRLRRLAEARGPGTSALLVLDGIDRFEAADRWLLVEALPAAGRESLVVVTSRRRASASLRTMTEPGVSLRERHVDELSPADVAEALRHAGVPPEEHARAYALTKGHPLTLGLLLERFAREPHLPVSLSDEPDILGEVVDQILRDAPDPEHKVALYALAIAGLLDEALLGRVVGAAGAEALFRHLASLSIVERSRHGLVAQPLVRDVIHREHAARNPDQHALLVARVAEAVRDRRPAARSAEEALRLACQAAFVEAPSAAVRECCDFRWLADVRWRRAEHADHAAIVDHLGPIEGAEARRALEGAAGRCEAFVLALRDGSLGAVVVVEDASAPRARLRWIGGRPRQAMGRELWTALVALEDELRRRPATRELVATVPPADPLARHLIAFGFAPRADHDGARHLVLSVLSDEPADGPAAASAAAPATPTRPRAALDRASFDAAWRAALPLLHRPLELSSSPLSGSALGQEGPQALLAAASAATAALAGSAGYADAARVLDVTFIRPAPKQEAAAAALGVPYGTYRYQLRKATALLLEELWNREQAARPG